MDEFSFRIKPLPPFSLKLTAWALKRRDIDKINFWDGAAYRRAVVLGDRTVGLSLFQGESDERPVIKVVLNSGSAKAESCRMAASRMVERMFGAKLDLNPFYVMAERDRSLAPLVREFVGLKPPRFPTIFEALINAFACQQVSLVLGIMLLNRLAAECGRTFKSAAGVLRAFPLPQDLVLFPAEDYRKLGFSRQKARAIIELSDSVLGKGLDLESLERMDNEEAKEFLYRIRGVGRWSAEYVLLRGLGRLDTFPADDVGGQKNIAEFFGLRKRPDYEGIKKRITRWHPFEGFVYFHFLLKNLRQRGLIG